MNSSFKLFMLYKKIEVDKLPTKTFKMGLESSLAISDVY